MQHANQMKTVDFQSRRTKLMSGREIEIVVFLGNTEIFEEKKRMAFLLVLRPTYMQNFSSLAELSDFCGHFFLK